MNRLQQLAGINEDATNTPSTPGTSTAPNNTKQAPDAETVIKLVSNNTSLMNRLKNINNAKEITDVLTFILNNINDKPSGVNKFALKNIIDKRFK